MSGKIALIVRAPNIKVYKEGEFYMDSNFRAVVLACANAGWVDLYPGWDGPHSRVKVYRAREVKHAWVPDGHAFKLSDLLAKSGLKAKDTIIIELTPG